MTKLVINADDFGYSPGVNYGIIDSHQQGVLTSTTLMANMPGFEHAVALSHATPTLGIGVHLSMTCGSPVLGNVEDLLQKNGQFKSLAELKAAPDDVNLDQLYAEWDGQINKVKEAGIRPTHLDSHHYTHSYGNNSQVMEALATRHGLPLRNCFEVREKLKDPSLAPALAFWNLFNYPSMKDVSLPYERVKDQLFEIIQKDGVSFGQSEVVEAVCHPGYVDARLWLGSSFHIARTREIELLCDPALKELLKVLNYQLCCYNEL